VIADIVLEVFPGQSRLTAVSSSSRRQLVFRSDLVPLLYTTVGLDADSLFLPRCANKDWSIKSLSVFFFRASIAACIGFPAFNLAPQSLPYFFVRRGQSLVIL